MWKSTGSNHPINFLLFISPISSYSYLFNIIGKDNLRIYDYHTQDVNNLYQAIEVDLDGMLKSNIASEKSIVIINCLSSLILTVGLARTVRFVEKLSSRVRQLICIYRREFATEIIPRIETLGTTYVRLEQSKTIDMDNNISYEVFLTHCKRGGGILKKHAHIIQDAITYEIKSEKTPQINAPKSSVVSEPVIKPRASFRIDMNARELQQRNNTPLPYILNGNLGNESKILYVPDEVDDFDEEDPDDDLPF